jgi:CheY-like chemotaxis protein
MTPGTAAGRVLVVDDDRAFRHAISTFLREAGHHLTEVPDGRAALAALSSEPFDVILLDIGLPGISGHEAAPVINMAARFLWSRGQRRIETQTMPAVPQTSQRVSSGRRV